MSGLFALMLLTATAAPAQAQMDDGELPKIDFAVNLMQSAQFLSVDDNNPYVRSSLDGSHSGFHQVRAGLNASVQFSENVSGLLMLEAEPNDFGQNLFSPEVDFAILDIKLSDNLTFRTGTPVTGLLNFRGFSDGPVVQGNPLIGNSPADMITAAQGIKLIGSYETFGFDMTINRSFASTFASQITGVNLIGKVRYTGSNAFKVGAGLATHTGEGVNPYGGDPDGNGGVVFANGDRENYNFPGTGASSTETHVNMPDGTIFQADSKITVAGLSNDLWIGYAMESNFPGYGGDFNAFFAGLGTKIPFSKTFYAAGRFTYVGDQSSAVNENNSTAVSRIQLGFGYKVYDKALFKVEYVRQVEGAGTALSRINNNWSGITTELSFNF